MQQSSTIGPMYEFSLNTLLELNVLLAPCPFLFPEPILFPKTPPLASTFSVGCEPLASWSTCLYCRPISSAPHPRPWPGQQDNCPSSPLPVDCTACSFKSTDYDTHIDCTNTVSHNWYWLVPPAVIMAALLRPICASGFLFLCSAGWW